MPYTPHRSAILLVDDDPSKRMALEAMLDGLPAQVVTASSGEDALRLALVQDFALILLDVYMPGIDGLETARLIRQRPRSARTPILFMTGAGDDPELASRAYDLGAVDFLVTPIALRALHAKVTVFLELDQARGTAERQARWLMDHASDGIWSLVLPQPIPVDAPFEEQLSQIIQSARLEQANPVAQRLLGIPAEVVTRGWPPRLRAGQVQDLVTRLVGHGYRAEQVETTHAGDDGTEHLLHTLIGAVHHGRLERIWVTSRDVTRERRDQQTIADSEDRFRALAEGVPDLVWSAGPDGLIRYANPQYLEHLGMDLEQARATSWRQIFHPDDHAEIFARWSISLAQGVPFEMEYRMRRGREGAWRWFLCRGVPRRDRNGTIIGWIGTCTDIHDRREAAERLAVHSRVLESMAEGVCLADEQGTILYANPAQERLLGVAAGALVGRDVIGLAVPERRAQVRAALAEAAAAGAWSGFSEIERGDGPPLATQVRIARLERDHRRLLVLVHEDITARVAAERALAERERLLSLVTETLPALVSYIDASGRYRFVNRAYEHWLQVRAADLVGTSIFDLLPREVPKIRHRIEQALRGEPQSYEERIHYPSGARDVQVQYAPNIDPDNGTVQGFVALVQDISERRRREARTRFLAEATATLGATLEVDRAVTQVVHAAVPALADWAAIDLLTPDGTLRRVTLVHHDATTLALGQALSRIVPPGSGNSARQVLSSRRPFLLRELTDEQLAKRFPDPAQLAAFQALGLRSVLILPLLGGSACHGLLTMVTSKDSERRFDQDDLAFGEELARRIGIAIDNAALYQEAERARTAAEHAREQLMQTNAELEQFAYISSHDLKEPIRMIGQFAGLLSRRMAGRLSPEEERYLERVVQGAQRMHQLVEDLLEYTHIDRESARIETVALDGVVAQVLETLGPAIAESRAQVEVGALPSVQASRTAMVQLFQNLIANAIKFRGAADPLVRVRCQPAADGYCEVSVSDNGIGIDPEHQSRIFGVFQRLHAREQYPGTGIGLSVCKKIVERLGGRIWIESASGKGATFRVTLPSAQASAAESTPAAG